MAMVEKLTLSNLDSQQVSISVETCPAMVSWD